MSRSTGQVKAMELGIPIVGPDKVEQILEEAVAAAELAEREAEAELAAAHAQHVAYWNHMEDGRG